MAALHSKIIPCPECNDTGKARIRVPDEIDYYTNDPCTMCNGKLEIVAIFIKDNLVGSRPL